MVPNMETALSTWNSAAGSGATKWRSAIPVSSGWAFKLASVRAYFLCSKGT
jgi:hypothetical protein